MHREMRVSLSGLVVCCAHVMDLISPQVANHHARVASIASSLADEMGLSRSDWRDIVLAAALHDVGALSLRERLDVLRFDVEESRTQDHAALGFELLRDFRPLERSAQIVKHHHVWWQQGAGAEASGDEVPVGSHVVHLADRVAVLLHDDQEILAQGADITKTVRQQAGKMFQPDLVDALAAVATKEHFWLDVGSVSAVSLSHALRRLGSLDLDLPDLIGLGEMFSRIIDFRSPFTATHSAGVAASAEAIARLIGYTTRECRRMCVAGYLHDLGKLRVPREILEKPAGLTEEERMIVRSHTYYAYRAVEHISGLHGIPNWAFLHHERMDGNGYPFHLGGDELSLGSRIMAVADVFTALTEDRPYRSGLDEDRAMAILRNQVAGGGLDPIVFEQVRGNFDEINQLRKQAQLPAMGEYERLRAEPSVAHVLN